MVKLSGIRVTYSGLISLIAGLVSVITSLSFIIILTRTLTPTDFGTWGLITSLMIYPFVIQPIISYWVIREIARDKPSGKTAIMASGGLSAVGILIYFFIAYYLGNQSEVEQSDLFFGISLIPFIFLNDTLTQINLGWKPQIASFGGLLLNISKLPAALILVYFLDLGFSGAIIALIVSYITSILYQSIKAREKISNKINISFLKKWLKLFWLPLYPEIATSISRLDIIIFTVVSGSVAGLAFWTASIAITMLTAQAGSISTAVYPKLLQDENKEYIQTNLTQLFYFAIPFVIFSIVFAREALFALNPLYESASFVVIFLTVQMFFGILSRTFQSFLMGIEKVDLNEKSTFNHYINSKLFFLPTIRIIQTSTYIGIFSIGLLLLVKAQESVLVLVTYWSFIWMISEIPLTLYLYTLVRKNLKFSLEFTLIIKYLLVSIGLFGIIYVVFEKFIIYKPNLIEFLPQLLLFMIPGMLGYVILTYFLDSRTRNLVHSIIKEFR